MTKIYRKTICLLMLISTILLLAGCDLFHEHTWSAATCTSPEVCLDCGETKEGSVALGHTWTDATCELPKTCSVCHTTDGSAIGHAWVEANCQSPTYCSVCNHKPNEELGNHVVKVWDQTTESTCTQLGNRTGKCSICATPCTEEVPLKEHTLNEWVVTSTPQYGVPGKSEQSCSVCNQTINTKEVKYSEYIANRYTLVGETKGFEITDCDTWYVQDGKYSGDYVSGVSVVEVVNTGNQNLLLNECVFEFEDDLGQFLGTGGIVDMVVAVPSVIAPGETGYFIRKIVCPMEDLDTSNGLNAKTRIDIKYTTKDAVYYDVEYRAAGFDVSGTVHNATTAATNNWEIAILYKNDKGQVIAFLSDYFRGETLGVDEYRTISLTNDSIDPIIEKQIDHFEVLAWNCEDEP